MDKKYQVFISSTFTDLHDERRSIMDILLQADCIPAGMEAFTATDEEQFAVIKKVIDLCDYYILIIGNRYGSINTETGISYTEMEYEYAISQGIPVLVFAVNNPEYPTDRDDEKAQKLELFRHKALDNRLASIWINVGDLQGKVAIAIMKAKNDLVRPGWSRVQQYDELVYLRERDELRKKLQHSEATCKMLMAEIDSYRRDTSTLAFEDESIEIEYSYNVSTGNSWNRRHATATLAWKELFRVVSINMSNVSITESTITSVIRRMISDKSIEITNPNIVKVIVNQFEVLGYITHKWIEGRGLFYSLTAAGNRLKNDLNLIHKSNSID